MTRHVGHHKLVKRAWSELVLIDPTETSYNLVELCAGRLRTLSTCSVQLPLHQDRGLLTADKNRRLATIGLKLDPDQVTTIKMSYSILRHIQFISQ